MPLARRSEHRVPAADHAERPRARPRQERPHEPDADRGHKPAEARNRGAFGRCAHKHTPAPCQSVHTPAAHGCAASHTEKHQPAAPIAASPSTHVGGTA